VNGNEVLRRGLRIEVESALLGEAGPAVALLLRPERLPRAVLTDRRGVVAQKVISYVDLLATLDRSAIVEQLEREAVRSYSLPPLPAGAVLLSVEERPSGATYAVTGATRAASHLFTLRQGDEESTHLIPLPPIAYRAVWEEATRSLKALSIALCSPELSGEPTPHTELYRWPFSNVYENFGGALEGVCWYQRGSVRLSLDEIPEKAVFAFVGIPNEADRYSGDLTHRAPYGGYRTFLEAIEEGGGIAHEWLVPCGMTVKDLHYQNRRNQRS
jgi:hypothetical protein